MEEGFRKKITHHGQPMVKMGLCPLLLLGDLIRNHFTVSGGE